MAAKRLYSSANGDTWDLICEGDSVCVRHQPNAASGGNTTDYDVATFLARDWRKPQAVELVRLVGTLVADG